MEFGPSRSTRFARAVAEARKGDPAVAEIEPGRFRARFALEREAGVYAALAALIQRVWRWRASEVYEEEETVSPHHAKEMAWCASSPGLVRYLPVPVLLRGVPPVRALSAVRC